MLTVSDITSYVAKGERGMSDLLHTLQCMQGGQTRQREPEATSTSYQQQTCEQCGNVCAGNSISATAASTQTIIT